MSFPLSIRQPTAPQIATGGDSQRAHSLALKHDGTVERWGNNIYGQISIPRELSGIVAIAAGALHSLALKSNGTVAGWGDNTYGQLTIPTGLSSVVALATYYLHSLALKNDGTVVGWGNNTDGQITIPNGLSGVVAIAASFNQSFALKSNGTVVTWGGGSNPITILSSLSGVVAITAGSSHFLALKSDGTVVGFGNNTWGQITIPSNLSGVVALAAGWYYSVALKSDGTVVRWGDNGYTGVPIPSGLSNVVAIASSQVSTLALKSNGTVVGWGDNSYGQIDIPAGLNLLFPQTINAFSAIPSKTPGATPFTITLPTASSGLTVVVTVKSGPATINGNTVTINGTEGTVVLAANQSGNVDYAAASEVTTSFTVAKLTQTISAFATIPSKTPGATPFTITLPAASSGLTVAVTVKSGPATINGNTVTLNGTEGTVVLAANQSGNADYSAASEVTTSFTVGKLSQTITPFATIPSKTPGATPFTITLPTASSGLTVAVTVKSGPATINGNTVTLNGTEGTVVLAANQSGNADYSAASEVTTSFTVGKLSQTITPFATIPSKTPGATPFTITLPTASSGLTVAVTVKSGPATISGNTVTLNGTEGTVVLAANQSGNANYSAASEVTTSFTVGKLTVGIVVNNLNQTYTGSPCLVTVTTYPAGLTSTVTYNGSTTPPTNAGSYTVLATITDADHIGSQSSVLYIAHAVASVTLSGPTSITYDGSAHSLTATTTPNGLATAITYNGSNSAPVTSGTYSVAATITNSNYVGWATSQIVISGQPYYYNNATGDQNLQTLGNWWNNSSHTTAATSLPTANDTVYIDGLITDATLTVTKAIFGKYSSNLIQSYPSGRFYCIECEFWNGFSFSGDQSWGSYSRITVVYPCACPFLNIISENPIKYIGYPYAIAQTASDLAIQQLWIDNVNHGSALWGQQPPNNGQPSWNVTQTSVSPGTLKEGDDFLFQVAFHAGSSFLDPQVTTISCTFLDPASRSVVLSSANFIPCVVTSWGDPSFFSYLFYLPITNPVLSKCFGSFADGVTESVTLIGEVAWQEVNQTGVGPSSINRRSQNFPVTITRSLNQGADFTS